MKITEHLSVEQKTAFFDVFFGEYAKYSFGGMPKRDLDTLIFHALIESKILSEEMKNRAIANLLSISETKAKAFLLERSYKFLSDKREENACKILERIASGDTNIVRLDGMIVFVVENPVARADLEYILKEELGYFIDSSFNKEIVKINEAAFLAFVLKFYSGKSEEFRAKLLSEFSGQKEITALLDADKNWMEKAQEFVKKGETVTSVFELVKKAVTIGMMLM